MTFNLACVTFDAACTYIVSSLVPSVRIHEKSGRAGCRNNFLRMGPQFEESLTVSLIDMISVPIDEVSFCTSEQKNSVNGRRDGTGNKSSTIHTLHAFSHPPHLPNYSANILKTNV